MPAVILCGGVGSRLAEETERMPKPLVEIGGRPILWHIMKFYSYFGFNKFILCLGYKGDMIRDYFLNYEYNQHDLKVKVGSGGRSVQVLSNTRQTENWEIILADTGLYAMTGARVKKIERYVDSETFLLTYGDGVTDVDVSRTVDYHFSHGRVGTVTGVRPPSRFGELVVCNVPEGEKVESFQEKPNLTDSVDYPERYINGGFYVFSKRFFNYLPPGDQVMLEKEPMETLSQSGQLMMYSHHGFWQCMDTVRDLNLLRDLWQKGAPWKVWEERRARRESVLEA
ncbi:MAG: glucose-1-phosphate cytidylyltransferase [Bacteriovoracia bacterium]